MQSKGENHKWERSTAAPLFVVRSWCRKIINTGEKSWRMQWQGVMVRKVSAQITEENKSGKLRNSKHLRYLVRAQSVSLDLMEIINEWQQSLLLSVTEGGVVDGDGPGQREGEWKGSGRHTSQLRLRTQACRTTLNSCGCLGCWWLRKRIPVSPSTLTKPGWEAGSERQPCPTARYRWEGK